MTIGDLLSWANGLGICTFARRKDSFHGEEIVCEGKDGSMDLHFGRFNESVSVDGGRRCVHFGACYKTEPRPFDGMGYASCDLSKIAKDIERYAERLNLVNPQMTLF